MRKFIFKDYVANLAAGCFTFNYTMELTNGEELNFAERIVLPAEREVDANVSTELLDKVLQGVHLMLGISYYKLYCPEEVEIPYELTPEQAQFWSTVYRKGLGEFCHQNGLPLDRVATFPSEDEASVEALRYPRRDWALVGIGGGKDSIVVAELLMEAGCPQSPMVIETQKPSPVVAEVMEQMASDPYVIHRYLDPQIFALSKEEGTYNGHVPISAVFAWLGLLAGLVYDYRYVVVGNEHSSNFGNIEYDGEEINHQWSKSLEFELMFQEYVRKFVTPDITCFSLLRSFYEIRIAKMFTRYPQYFQKFTSDNSVFRVNEERPDVLWTKDSAKSCFVFLMLAAFMKPVDIEQIFSANYLDDPELISIFKDLLGFGEMKPFDCVGTFKESQAAMWLAAENGYNDCAVVKELSGLIKDGEELVKEVMQTQQAPGLPAKFAFCGKDNAYIMGYGREGKITEQYLQENYPHLQLTIGDKSLDEDYLEKQTQYDIAIKTPGMPSRLVEIPLTTATNIFFAEVPNFKIGVTGSKGKSTTSTLIYEILKAAGKKVRLLGNIGEPMLSVLLEGQRPDPDEIFVLELSSYQLEHLSQSCEIVAVTSLFPEHMPHHGSEEAYYEAKSRIAKWQKPGDRFIYNDEFPMLQDWAEITPATAMTFRDDLGAESWERNLIGDHNVNNIRAAATVALELEIELEVIKQVVAGFKGLKHRLDLVGEFKGIKFYDDAIATNPQATVQAIKSLTKEVGQIGTILLGGSDRGADFAELEDTVREAGISNVVLFPDSGKRMFKSHEGLNILEANSMAEAVSWASEVTKEGEVCVLSTASPSFSLWKNFEEKGDQFRKEVGRLAQN